MPTRTVSSEAQVCDGHTAMVFSVTGYANAAGDKEEDDIAAENSEDILQRNRLRTVANALSYCLILLAGTSCSFRTEGILAAQCSCVALFCLFLFHKKQRKISPSLRTTP